jgi:hypothetical protein
MRIIRIDLLPSIIHFGLMTDFILMRKDMQKQLVPTITINKWSLIVSEKKSLTMLGKVTIAVYSLMVKLDQANLIRWWVMEQIRGSFLFLVKRYSTG